MRKTFIAAASAAAIAWSPAAAQDLMGFGAVQCGQLARTYAEADMIARSQMVLALGQWSFGYLSGRNAGETVSKDISALDSDRTALFIIDVCGKNPGYVVYEVVEAIYQAAPYMRGTS